MLDEEIWTIEIPAAEIVWQNRRWAVTTLGIESRYKVEYVIPKSRLLERRDTHGGRGISAWALQLADKTWVDDIGEFLEAFEQALEIHLPGAHDCIDPQATAVAARAEWAEARPMQR